MTLLGKLQLVGTLTLLIALGHDATAELLASRAASAPVYPVEAATTAEPETRTNEKAAAITRAALPERSAPTANPFIPRQSAEQPVAEAVQRPSEAALARALDSRALQLTAFSADPEPISATARDHCKALVEQTLRQVPNELTDSLEQLTLYFSHRRSRGLSNARLLELRCSELADTEIVAVLVHELGHIADLGALRGTGEASGFTDGSYQIPQGDPSVEFYQLSWADSQTKRFSAEQKDFVSGYAATDPFEDFAESFTYYILHGADFRLMSAESETLAKKYAYLRESVFTGVEYDSAETAKEGRRVWDATLVPYELHSFWAGGSLLGKN
jgi:hypothetical protein